MDKYLVNHIANKLACELMQDDMEELLMCNEDLSYALHKAFANKMDEYDAEISILKVNGNKHHTVVERRQFNANHKGSDRSKGKRSHWDCKMYNSGRNNEFCKSAKERRYAETGNLSIDNCTMQEAMETAEMEIRQRKRDELDDQYMDINAKIANAYTQISALHGYIEDLKAEKAEIIRAFNELVLK